MTLREAMQAVYDQHGHLTPTLVVDVARDPDNPLHSAFQWDDAVAAEKYRLDQARTLIRSFRVVYKDTPDDRRDVPQYVSIHTTEGQVYRATDEVVSDEFTRRLLFQGLERDVNALRRKYGHLAEFADIVRDRLLGGETA